MAAGHHRFPPHMAPSVRAARPGRQRGKRPRHNRTDAPIRAHATAAPAARIPRDVRGRTLTVLLRSLRAADLKVVEIPYRPKSTVFEGIPSAVGNYVNFLQVGSILIVPSYGLAEDKNACNVLGAIFPRFSLEMLGCRVLGREGGVLNCCTWTTKKSTADCSKPSTRILSPASDNSQLCSVGSNLPL